MVLLPPDVEELITPGIRQRVCNECGELLVDPGILTPNGCKSSCSIDGCNQGRDIQSSPDPLRVNMK